MSFSDQSARDAGSSRLPMIVAALLLALFFLPWTHWTVGGEQRSLAGYEVLLQGFAAPSLSRQAAEARIAEQDGNLVGAIERAEERAAEALAEAREAQAEADADPSNSQLQGRAERRQSSADRAQERVADAEAQLQGFRELDHELWTHDLFYVYPLLLLLLPLGALATIGLSASGRGGVPAAASLTAVGGVWALMAPHLWFGMAVIDQLTLFGALSFLLSLTLVPAALGVERTATLIDRLNHAVGAGIAWLALFMVLVQFALVLMRYVFGIGSIMTQESVIYAHGALFMIAAGYTLLVGGHVRVDVFYRESPPRKKAWVDMLGVIFLLIPVCLVIWRYALPYVLSSWAVLEGSRETSGIPGVYLLKTCMLVFVVLLILQGISLALRSALVIAGRRETVGPATAGGH
jgi:TRAP-type mannitol/chloroaromatic compound transport system permease small subunit